MHTPYTNYFWAFSRGLFGALVMASSLGIASAVGELGHVQLGIDGVTRQLLQAVLCSSLAVPLIIMLRCRIDRQSLAGLGLPSIQESLHTFTLGMGVTIGAASVLFGLGTAMGWIRWSTLNVPIFALFLATTAPIALLYEALPEELTLRGYAYSSLNARLRRWTALVATIVLFLIVPGISTVVHAGVISLLGGTPPMPTIAPRGEDPVAYFILLTVFGATLALARITTDSLWTSVALHLTFLLINRVVLFGAQRDAGWSAELTTPAAILLVPGYAILAALALLVFAKVRGRSIGWRDRISTPTDGA